MNISPFLSVNHSCDDALQWSKERLTRAGLRPVQTFDLRAARTAFQDCPCPNHGTEDCDCQMVVILVYGKTEEPMTLIMHGNDGQTWLSLANNSIQHADNSIQLTIERVLQLDSEKQDSLLE